MGSFSNNDPQSHDQIADAIVYNAGFSYTEQTVTVAIRIFDDGYDPYTSWRVNDIDHCSYATFDCNVDGNEAFLRDLNALMRSHTIFQVPRSLENLPMDEKVRFFRLMVKLLGGF